VVGRLFNTLFGTVKIISQNPCLTGEEKRRTSVVPILAKRCRGLGCSIHKFRKSINIAYRACNSRIILPFNFDPRIPINTANQGNGTHLSWEFRILSFSLLIKMASVAPIIMLTIFTTPSVIWQPTRDCIKV
jgi:hypothetical protein